MQSTKAVDRFIQRNRKMSSSTVDSLQGRTQFQSSQNYEKYLSRQMFQSLSLSNSLEQQLRKKLDPQVHKTQTQKYQYRAIPTAPQKVLDAPEIKDDYYLNLLDWSSKGVLAIGLTEKVYLYSTKQITQLCSLPQNDYVCSLSFHPQGSLLSVGLTNGNTQIYDIQRETVVRTLQGHTKRVSSSAFTYGLLYTGSRDSAICAHDYRSQSNVVSKMIGHRGEVCGLKHDPCGLASGSNDNMAIIWDINMGRPRNYLLGHKAAVKALSWCPWQRNLLATGGGSADKTLRLWNVETGKNLKQINTQSQVCSLIWNKEQKELISSHGYVENQLCVWKVGKSSVPEISCKKIGQLYGHTQRVLHMAQSPDESTICTASADETLRFWRIFDKNNSLRKFKKQGVKDSLQQCTLR